MADYGFVHADTVFTPNGTPGIDPAENLARNHAIEQSELADWRMRPAVAVGYFTFPAETGGGLYRSAFYPSRDRAVVSTWLGTELGTIVRARVFAHNFGGRMVSIVVRGNNGAYYSGKASWDNGQVIRLRRMK